MLSIGLTLVNTMLLRVVEVGAEDPLLLLELLCALDQVEVGFLGGHDGRGLLRDDSSAGGVRHQLQGLGGSRGLHGLGGLVLNSLLLLRHRQVGVGKLGLMLVLSIVIGVGQRVVLAGGVPEACSATIGKESLSSCAVMVRAEAKLGLGDGNGRKGKKSNLRRKK